MSTHYHVYVADWEAPLDHLDQAPPRFVATEPEPGTCLPTGFLFSHGRQ